MLEKKAESEEKTFGLYTERKNVCVQACFYCVRTNRSNFYAGKTVGRGYRISFQNKVKIHSHAADFTHSVDWG